MRWIISGILTVDSLAWHCAAKALQRGDEVVLTYNPRHKKIALAAIEELRPLIAEKTINSKQLLALPLDLTSESELNNFSVLLEDAGVIEPFNGVIHSVAFAPRNALGLDFLAADWNDVSVALHTSVYSLVALVKSVRSWLEPGSAILTLSFDTFRAWPGYAWMGVCKAALESVVKYLARALGPEQIRVNGISAGPLDTVAARAITGFEPILEDFSRRAPIGWSTKSQGQVASSILAFAGTDFAATTGQILYVDGGAVNQG